MNSNNIPSQDPANTNSLVGSIIFALRKWLESVDDALPVQVLGFTPPTSTDFAYVSCRSLIQIVGTGGQLSPRETYPKIPVLMLGGGGFIIYFPVKEGDIGYIKAMDRDISLYLQSGGTAKPNINALHSFSSSIFIPQAARNLILSEEDMGNLVLQTLDGISKISIGDEKITISAPSVEIIGETIINMTGNLAVNGNITATGTITPGVE